MKLPAASTKRTGQPRWAQRLETATKELGVLVELLRALADVGGGLAGVADPLGLGEDDLAVGVLDEVVDRADRLPALLAAVEDRRDGEADGGQDDGGAGDSAQALGGDREGATASHRLALEVAGRVGLHPLLPGSLFGPVHLVRVVCHVASRNRPCSLLPRRRADVAAAATPTARIGLDGHGDHGETVVERQGSRLMKTLNRSSKLFASAAAALLALALCAGGALAVTSPEQTRESYVAAGRTDLQDQCQDQRTDPRRGTEAGPGRQAEGRRRPGRRGPRRPATRPSPS